MKKETIKIDLSWIKDIFIQIWVFINPNYWIMNENYSKTWDDELKSLMNEHSFTEIGEYQAKLGNTTIWISNHPYASFTNYTFGRNISGRASRLTIYKAKQKLDKDKIASSQNPNKIGFNLSINDLMLWVRILLNPNYWITTERYSKTWNDELNRLMNEHSFTEIDEYTAKLGNTTVWVANHPYVSFTNYNTFRFKGRPSRLTIYKAKQKLIWDKNNPQPIRMNNGMGVNPCGEIFLGGGNTYSVIGSGQLTYSGSSQMMCLGIKNNVNELNNGIPNNWDNEV